MAKDTLDVRGAAALVGRHPETVRRWVWSGRLRAHRDGRRMLVARADLEALMAGDSHDALTLAEWAERARATRAAAGVHDPGGSAADLVIEDRAARAGR